jgi:DNA-binding XRE family transcriptional regulator
MEADPIIAGKHNEVMDTAVVTDTGLFAGMTEENRSVLATRIGKRLLAQRKECQLNQTQVAERMNVSRVRVSEIESGLYLPSIETIYKYCVAVGKDPVVFGLEFLNSIRLPECPEPDFKGLQTN